MSKNKNKNKNNQDYTSSKTINETANEDKELIKYLYDKEIERSKLIVDKSAVAFFFFAVDSGFLAINWKEFFRSEETVCQLKSSKSPIRLLNMAQNYNIACSAINKYKVDTPIWALIILLAVVIAAAVLIIISFGFTTKINTSDSKTTIADYYEYLHIMNNKKEKFIFSSYVLLAFSVCLLLCLSFFS